MIRFDALRRGIVAAMAVGCMALMGQQGHATGYVQRNLTSDVPLLADFTDPSMVNPWGVVFPAIWICNNRTGAFNVYGADGTPSTTVTTACPVFRPCSSSD